MNYSVGDTVTFRSADGSLHTGTIVRLWRDWYSVKTPESRCPYPVSLSEIVTQD